MEPKPENNLKTNRLFTQIIKSCKPYFEPVSVDSARHVSTGLLCGQDTAYPAVLSFEEQLIRISIRAKLSVCDLANKLYAFRITGKTKLTRVIPDEEDNSITIEANTRWSGDNPSSTMKLLSSDLLEVLLDDRINGIVLN